MAELHIIGQIESASNFSRQYSLFCRYSFQSGPNWSLISGCPEGQTVTGKIDNKDIVFWSQPFDVHYVAKGLQGWPKLLFQVCCLDSVGRSWTVGYSCATFPTVPGHHNIEVPCWAPAPTTIGDRLRQHFLGGSHQLIKTDIVNLGVDRYKLKTQSKGNITVKVDIILRNFSQFGVEYK